MNAENRYSLADVKTGRLSVTLGNVIDPGFALEERFKLQASILDSPDQAVYSARDLEDGALVYVVFCQDELVWQMIEKWQRVINQREGFKQVIFAGDFVGVRFAVYQGLAADEQLLQDVQITSLEQVTAIVRRLGEYLRELHADYFVYGDLSPATIAISTDLEKITITAPLFRYLTGYYLDDERPTEALIDNELADYGIGDFITPLAYSSYWPYVSPEVCVGDLSPRSDIFSFGAILYWLIVGGKPSFVTSPPNRTTILLEDIDYVYSNKINQFLLQEEMFRQKFIGPIDRFAERYNKMQYNWKSVFEKALRGDIISRYDNIEHFLADYERYIATKTATITIAEEGTGDKVTGEGAKPVPNVSVMLRSKWGDWFQVSSQTTYESVTDGDGRCVIVGIVPGDYMLDVRASGSDFEPRHAQQVDITVDLEHLIVLKKRSMINRLLRRS